MMATDMPSNGNGKRNGNGNGWSWFDCWSKRIVALAAIVAIFAGAVLAYADLRNVDSTHADRLTRIEAAQQDQRQQLEDQNRQLQDMNTKLTRAVTILERMDEGR